jgi:hypothetical protein
MSAFIPIFLGLNPTQTPYVLTPPSGCSLGSRESDFLAVSVRERGLLECRKRKELDCHKLLKNPRLRSGIELLKYLLIQRLESVSTTTRPVRALRIAGSLYLFVIITLNLRLRYFR